MWTSVREQTKGPPLVAHSLYVAFVYWGAVGIQSLGRVMVYKIFYRWPEFYCVLQNAYTRTHIHWPETCILCLHIVLFRLKKKISPNHLKWRFFFQPQKFLRQISYPCLMLNHHFKYPLKVKSTPSFWWIIKRDRLIWNCGCIRDLGNQFHSENPVDLSFIRGGVGRDRTYGECQKLFCGYFTSAWVYFLCF